MLFLCPLLCVFIHPHSSKAKGLCHSVCVCIFKSLQSCLPLCDPMDCSPPGSSVHGILQARILEWLPGPPPGDPPDPGIEWRLSCLLRWQAGSSPPSHLGSPLSLLISHQRANWAPPPQGPCLWGARQRLYYLGKQRMKAPLLSQSLRTSGHSPTLMQVE